jgi:copper(I)-binding protein
MNYLKIFSFSVLLLTFVFAGCGKKSDSDKQKKKKVVLGKMELSDGWARPGSKGQTSGIYLTIANGTASADTLLKAHSNIAKKTTLHESYTEENGVMGMREAGPQIIAEGEKLRFSPGGFHIMLMRLKQNLAIGDSIKVSLNFARVGEKTLTVPVKMQNQ